ncbi:MAG: metallopeptidase family protein [Dehalococcoidia bacterium]|nr:metallopeptidase family protein [Dehalococcoidia bacterium]
MTRRAFRRMVQQAMNGLPETITSVLDNVAIVVEPEPTEEQLDRMRMDRHDTLFGLFEGVPLPQRTSDYGMVLPDKITLFQHPLEDATGSSAELQQEITKTIVHEIAHHVGWSDADVERMGYG